MRILDVRDLSRHFGGLKAVEAVDLHIDEGEVVSLKTTSPRSASAPR